MTDKERDNLQTWINNCSVEAEKLKDKCRKIEIALNEAKRLGDVSARDAEQKLMEARKWSNSVNCQLFELNDYLVAAEKYAFKIKFG